MAGAQNSRLAELVQSIAECDVAKSIPHGERSAPEIAAHEPALNEPVKLIRTVRAFYGELSRLPDGCRILERLAGDDVARLAASDGEHFGANVILAIGQLTETELSSLVECVDAGRTVFPAGDEYASPAMFLGPQSLGVSHGIVEASMRLMKLASGAGQYESNVSVASQFVDAQPFGSPQPATPVKTAAISEDSAGQGSTPIIADDEYSFEVHPEMVVIRGFGEKVSLENTEGVQRLINIVTAKNGRISVLELTRSVGRNGETAGSDTVALDLDGVGVSIREPGTGRFEPILGHDPLPGTSHAVGELISAKKSAENRSDDEEAARLTEQIDAALEHVEKDIQRAAAVVRKSLDRTYDRLKKDGQGTKLAKHFKCYIERPRKDADFVYAPPESEKCEWILK